MIFNHNCIYSYRNFYDNDFIYFFKNKYNFMLYSLLYLLQKRSESIFIFKNVIFLGKNNQIFFFYLFTILSPNSTFLKKKLISLYLFDLSFCYKGWRFFKSLPSKGQRTWTNAWTCSKTPNLVKNHKISFLKNFFGVKPNDYFNSLLLLEHYNLLWKLQWNDEWLELKKNRIISLKKKTLKKNNLISEDNVLTELLFIRNKFLKKKVRVQFKGGSYFLGFEPGYVLNYNN